MIFRQLFDRESCTYTYVLACRRTREAVIIDSVREMVARDEALLGELGVHLRYTLETHVHADHVTGAAALRARLGAKVVLARDAGVDAADLQLADGDVVRFGDQVLGVCTTPGHTAGCATYVTRDGMMAFTGDALFVRGCGRTDFQGGSARALYRSVHDKVFSLEDDCRLYPGHDYKGHTQTTVLEERLFNPRLGGRRTEDEFVAIMDGLGLAPPRLMDVAVPANLRCGVTDRTGPLSFETDAIQEAWAPVTRTATGAPDVTTEWVGENRAHLRVVDVREPDEFCGALGHVHDAELVPLGDLERAAMGWSRNRPIVLVCRSGGRSRKAAMILERHGFPAVASMNGGMQRWNELGLTVEA